MEPLWRKAKFRCENARTDRVDKHAIGMSMPVHTADINAALMPDKDQSLVELNDDGASLAFMKAIGQRITERLQERGKSQAWLASATGLSAQRLNNYIKGRAPDVASLVKIAKALETTTDWLLGVSGSHPPELLPVVERLLELAGLADDTAKTVAHAVQSALMICASMPAEGDVALRSRMAAQAAWLAQFAAKPS